MAQKMIIGIMPKEAFRQRTMAFARGDYKRTSHEPQIWFDSIESLAQILSTNNRERRWIIKNEQPKSMTELAKAAGRKPGNLSRTLKTMERYGIVSLQNVDKAVRPSVCVDDFRAAFGF
jgi:predicted transcriptional regulator